ncbi:MAG: phosphoethanolamine transferase [Alistipes sp.]|nr:phosphoethanolamine transferase [Candidatus Alistipes equi]
MPFKMELRSVYRSFGLMLVLMASCMLGYYDPACKFSFHLFTTSFLTATIFSLPTGFLPKYARFSIQLFIGETFILLSLVDVYCQEYLHSSLSTSIFSSILNTNLRETAEFLSSFFSVKIFLNWRITFLILLFFISPFFYTKRFFVALQSFFLSFRLKAKKIVYCLLLLLFVLSISIEANPFYNYLKFFFGHGALYTEELIFRHYHENVKLPFFRASYAYMATSQSKKLVEDILKNSSQASLESCSMLTPHIVLIIGESYNKHHSALYGYSLPTTPLQLKRFEQGTLFPFYDVVSPWNITSNAFLCMFSTWDSSRKDSIGNYPLFPVLFKRAGYHVTFFSNQYVTRGLLRTGTNQAGFFFLSSPSLCNEMFDYRNKKAYGFDQRAIYEFSKLKSSRGDIPYTLDIIHLMGQHFDYKNRYSAQMGQFSIQDIKRDDLSDSQKETVMHYDNATFSNDIVVDSILSLYENEDAVVVYLSDHGELVYDCSQVSGRLFETPTPEIAKYQFEVPMWIWGSKKFIDSHPDVISSIREGCNRPFSTDDLHQILFSLSGIECQYKDDSRNPLSKCYKPKKRIIAGEVDYDLLLKKYN